MGHVQLLACENLKFILSASVMLSKADPNRFPPLYRNRSDFLDKYIVLALLHNHYNVKIDIDELSSSEENG